jgi:hypothetical protein
MKGFYKSSLDKLLKVQIEDEAKATQERQNSTGFDRVPLTSCKGTNWMEKIKTILLIQS